MLRYALHLRSGRSGCLSSPSLSWEKRHAEHPGHAHTPALGVSSQKGTCASVEASACFHGHVHQLSISPKTNRSFHFILHSRRQQSCNLHNSTFPWSGIIYPELQPSPENAEKFGLKPWWLLSLIARNKNVSKNQVTFHLLLKYLTLMMLEIKWAEQRVVPVPLRTGRLKLKSTQNNLLWSHRNAWSPPPTVHSTTSPGTHFQSKWRNNSCGVTADWLCRCSQAWHLTTSGSSQVC